MLVSPISPGLGMVEAGVDSRSGSGSGFGIAGISFRVGFGGVGVVGVGGAEDNGSLACERGEAGAGVGLANGPGTAVTGFGVRTDPGVEGDDGF